MINTQLNIKSFQEISDEYEFVNRAIDIQISNYRKLIYNNKEFNYIGIYYNFSTIDEFSRKLKLEINKKYTLEITASFEAMLVYYFRNLLKRKNRLYKTYQDNIPKNVKRGSSPLMYHHILDIFKEEIYPSNKVEYAEFKSLIEYRNWLAHGRGWNIGEKYSHFDFEYTYEVILSIIKLLPNFPIPH